MFLYWHHCVRPVFSLFELNSCRRNQSLCCFVFKLCIAEPLTTQWFWTIGYILIHMRECRWESWRNTLLSLSQDRRSLICETFFWVWTSHVSAFTLCSAPHSSSWLESSLVSTLVLPHSARCIVSEFMKRVFKKMWHDHRIIFEEIYK